MAERVRVRVIPRRSMLATASASVVLVMLPLFGVLYWFAAEHDSVMLVFVVHMAVILLAAIVLLRQLSVHTVVTDTEIRGRGIFSPMVRVPVDRIASVHLIPTYVGQSPDPVVQLLLRDKDGKRLFRMRGNFWMPGDLERVVEALPIGPTKAPETMPLREFFEAYPGSAYWFENRPVLIAGLVGLVTVVTLAAAAWIMTVLGMRLPF